MYIGKFDDIIPLNISEQKSCLSNIKEVLQMGKEHPFTNFEIVLLKTLETQQREIGERSLENVKKLLCYLKTFCESNLDQEGHCTASCPCTAVCDHEVWQAAETEMKAVGIDIELG